MTQAIQTTPVTFSAFMPPKVGVKKALFFKAGASNSFWADIGRAATNYAGLICSNFFLANLLPVTLGNIFGGSVVVGLAQSTREQTRQVVLGEIWPWGQTNEKNRHRRCGQKAFDRFMALPRIWTDPRRCTFEASRVKQRRIKYIDERRQGRDFENSNIMVGGCARNYPWF